MSFTDTLRITKYNSMLWLYITTLLTCTMSNEYLPTVFWNPDSPTMDPRYWSKVANVKSFQTITFFCPNNHINNAMYRREQETGSYYNLYIREVPVGDRNLNYDTVCDPEKSRLVFKCEVPRTEMAFSHEMSKTFQIIKNQARPEQDPSLSPGKDYIFFSTSNGEKSSLDTTSTKCTMVFRVHHCDPDEECPVSNCSTYGREEVCSPKTTETEDKKISPPRDVNVLPNETSTSSVTVSWREPKTIATNISYYSVCLRREGSLDCDTQITEENERIATFTNLNASTVYKIRVRAYTLKGATAYSDEITVKTKKKAIVLPPPRPNNVIAEMGSDLSLIVSWQPARSNEDVLYYIVCLRKQGSVDCVNQLVERTMTSTIIYDLAPSTKYLIRVRAVSIAGPGNYSKEIEKEVKAPTTGKVVGERCPSIEVASLFIGLVIGVVITVPVMVLLWWINRKRKQDRRKGTVKNCANDAYRQSMVSDTFNLTADKTADKSANSNHSRVINNN